MSARDPPNLRRSLSRRRLVVSNQFRLKFGMTDASIERVGFLILPVRHNFNPSNIQTTNYSGSRPPQLFTCHCGQRIVDSNPQRVVGGLQILICQPPVTNPYYICNCFFNWQRLWLRLGVNVDDQLWLRLNPIPIPNCNPSANPSPSRNTNTNPNPNRSTTPLLTLTDPLTSK